MQSSTPNGQFAHPDYSVHALKPLSKILSFGPLARKPIRALRRVPQLAWSIDVKYRCLGLIGAEIANFGKSLGYRRRLTFGTPLQLNFRPISRNFWRRCLRIMSG